MKMAGMDRQIVLQQHDQRRNDFNVVQNNINQALVTRQKTIDVLKQKAKTADRIYQGCALSNRNANLTGAFGGGLKVAGGIILASDDISNHPLISTSFTSIGTVFCIGGGVWSLKNEYDRDQRNNDVKQEILQQLAEDDEALRNMNEALQGIDRGDFGEPSKVFRQLHIFVAGLFGIGMNVGSTAAIDILKKALPPIAYLLSSSTTAILLAMVEYLPLITAKVTLKDMEEVAKQSASSAVACMHDGFSKDFVEQEAAKAAQKAYKTSIDDDEKAALEEAKKVAKEGSNLDTEQTALQTAKQDTAKVEKATKAANEVASNAAEEGMKTAKKITRLITAGFGAFTFLWEGYNAYQNYKKSKQYSELGKELRFLANRMEEILRNRNEL